MKGMRENILNCILKIIFQKIAEDGKLPNSFYEATIIYLILMA